MKGVALALCLVFVPGISTEFFNFEDELVDYMFTPLPTSGTSGLRTSKKGFSLAKPNPDVLVWDRVGTVRFNSTTGLLNRSIYNGWLKVPLVHDPAILHFELPPSICLRVRAMAALQQPARNGPLLAHCGGPGSGRDCAMMLSAMNFDIDGQHEVIAGYDLLSIDQRGVNTSADRYEVEERWGKAPPCPFTQSGQAIEPFPMMYCDEMRHYIHYMHSPAKLLRMMVPLPASDIPKAFETYVKPIWKYGKIPFEGMAPMDETFVRWYYRMVKLEHSLCYEAKRYKLYAPNGREYNALQFGGTVDAAHDVDLLRQAIGAKKMSWYGASYGTSVAGVYASIFPASTHRVVMDGALNPRPVAEIRSQSSANGIQSVWSGLVKDCENSFTRNLSKDEVCPAAPGVSLKTWAVLRGDRSRAAVLLMLMHFSAFRTEILGPLVMACVQQFYSGEEVQSCQKFFQKLSARSTPSNGPKSSNSNGTNGTNGTDAESPSSNSTEPEPIEIKVSTDRFALGIQSMVMGTDSVGRYDEEDFIRWWKGVKETDFLGSIWAMSWMIAMSTWPAYARPVPPVGGDTPAVIIGNLHDPNTDYENAQLLKRSFPQGYLVTWQGYGHCLKARQHGGELSKAYNQSKQNDTLPVYTNGVAKYACMSKILSYLDNGTGIVDGHTCMRPQPLELGSAAALKMLEVV